MITNTYNINKHIFIRKFQRRGVKTEGYMVFSLITVNFCNYAEDLQTHH